MKRNKLFMIMVFLCSFSFITLAEEVAKSSSNGWLSFATNIASKLIILLLPAIGGGLLWIGAKLLTKVNLDKNEVAIKILTEIIRKAIQYVERWANTQKTKPSPDAKLNKALEIIENLASSDLGKSFVQKNKDKIIARVEAELEEIDPSYSDIDFLEKK